MIINQKPSPNFAERTRPILGYVIHGTLGSFESASNWLCTPPEKRPVLSYSSAHYVIAKDGRVNQLVSETKVAWHAGNVSNPTPRAKALLPTINGKILNPNESFIGIELEWFLGDKITEEQYKCVVEIIKQERVSNPVILCHKEITDYKSDFQTASGVVDNSIVEEIKRRLEPNLPPELTVVPYGAVKSLLQKLNIQVANLDFKGARDTTSYLFNELTKLK